MKDWIEKQIAIYSSPELRTPHEATAAIGRLLGAVNALRSGVGTVFGAHVADADVDRQALADGCLSAVRDMLPRCEQEGRTWIADNFPSLRQELGLTSTVPIPVTELVFLFDADYTNIDTDESASARKKAKLDRCRAVNTAVHTLPCIESLLNGLVTGSDFRLKWDSTNNVLHAELDLSLLRELNDIEFSKLVDIVQRELFFTGWGLNLEFDLGDHSDEDFGVWIESKIRSHVYRKR